MTKAEGEAEGFKVKRLIFLSALGGTLEFFDFVVFAFFVPVLSDLFLPPGVPEQLAAFQILCLFAAAYVVRPIGGVILAHFGDLLGRKQVFTLSLSLMALSTGAIALLPTYESIGFAAPAMLIILRLLQGAAIGGEVPGAWTFVSEHAPSRSIGLACGLVCAGLTFGILFGSLIGVAVTNAFDPAAIRSFAWRIPFLIGGLFGLVAVYLRYWLHETPAFANLRKRMLLVPRLPLRIVLEQHRESVLICIVATWVVSGCIVVTTLLNASFLHKVFNFSMEEAYSATSIAVAFLGVGCAFSGYLADRVNVATLLMIAGLVFAPVTYWYYAEHPGTVHGLYLKSALMGMIVGIVGVMPCIMVRAFPAAVRFTGVSFSYNVGYAVFGGLTPLILSGLFETSSCTYAFYLASIGALISATGLYIGLRKPLALAVHVSRPIPA